MADEGRREARQRRILENSERRLNRLMGINVENKQNEDKPTDEETEGPPSQPVIREENVDNEKHAYSLRNRRDVSSQNKGIESHNDSCTAAEPDVKKYTRTEKTSSDESETKTITANNAKTFSNIRFVVFLLLAVLVKITQYINWPLFYSKSIVFPFVLAEVTILYYQHSSRLPDSQPSSPSMLQTALQLNGVPKPILDTYSSLMNKLTIVATDLAVFLFSFIITHIIIG